MDHFKDLKWYREELGSMEEGLTLTGHSADAVGRRE